MDPTELERAAISEGVYPAFLAPIADFAGHLMRAMARGARTYVARFRTFLGKLRPDRRSELI